MGASAIEFDLARGLFQGSFIAGGENHRGAFRAERDRRFAADPRRGARNDNDLFANGAGHWSFSCGVRRSGWTPEPTERTGCSVKPSYSVAREVRIGSHRRYKRQICA